MADQSPFSLLCRDRDHAAYSVVGAAQVACAFLNLGEVPKALKTLMAALEEFNRQNDRISQFHKSAVQQSAAQEAA